MSEAQFDTQQLQLIYTRIPRQTVSSYPYAFMILNIFSGNESQTQSFQQVRLMQFIQINDFHKAFRYLIPFVLCGA